MGNGQSNLTEPVLLSLRVPRVRQEVKSLLTFSAMGLEGDVVTNVVRISAGWETSPHDWKALLQAIETVYAAMAG